MRVHARVRTSAPTRQEAISPSPPWRLLRCEWPNLPVALNPSHTPGDEHHRLLDAAALEVAKSGQVCHKTYSDRLATAAGLEQADRGELHPWTLLRGALPVCWLLLSARRRGCLPRSCVGRAFTGSDPPNAAGEVDERERERESWLPATGYDGMDKGAAWTRVSGAGHRFRSCRMAVNTGQQREKPPCCFTGIRAARALGEARIDCCVRTKKVLYTSDELLQGSHPRCIDPAEKTPSCHWVLRGRLSWWQCAWQCRLQARWQGVEWRVLRVAGGGRSAWQARAVLSG